MLRTPRGRGAGSHGALRLAARREVRAGDSVQAQPEAVEVDDGPGCRSCPEENEGDTALSWVFEGNR